MTNTTSWRVTALGVQIVGDTRVFELVAGDPDGVSPGRNGLFRSVEEPPAGWQSANWGLVSAKGYRP